MWLVTKIAKDKADFILFQDTGALSYMVSFNKINCTFKKYPNGWEDGTVGESFAVWLYGHKFKPQHSCQEGNKYIKQVLCCIFAISIPGRQKWEDLCESGLSL